MMMQRAREPLAMQRVASYNSYAEAERAIRVLASRKFPLDHVTIVAGNLRFVTDAADLVRCTGAATRGAIAGALTGLLVVFLLGGLAVTPSLGSGPLPTLYGVLLGAVVGAIAGAVAHAAHRGHRDGPGRRLDAGRYDLMVSRARAAEARRAVAPLRIATPA